jgi:hypothetical protein
MYSFNQNSGYGMALLNMLASRVGALGRIFVVMKSTNSSNKNYLITNQVVRPDALGQIRFFGTLLEAYNACESNNNDVILLDGNSAHTLATGLVWAKNRINVFGLDGGERAVQQGVKVQVTGDVAIAYVLKVTGSRNSFRNIKFIQGSTNAAALNVIQAAGEGNLYEDCSVVFGVANNLGSASASEMLMGEDAGTFKRVSFGSDVLLKSAASAVMTLDAITGASSADGAKSNRFIECEFVVMSSSANALCVKLADTAGAKFLNRFSECSFIAVINATNVAIAITNAIASAAGFVEGSLVFERPVTANCTNGCAGVTDKVVLTGAPVFSSNAWEGGTPA